MTDEQRNKLLKLEGLISVLLTKHLKLNEELKMLKSELLEAMRKQEASQEEIAKLQLENASLKTATAVCYTRDEAIAEKERLSSIIRKVDMCISLLK